MSKTVLIIEDARSNSHFGSSPAVGSPSMASPLSEVKLTKPVGKRTSVHRFILELYAAPFVNSSSTAFMIRTHTALPPKSGQIRPF